MADESRDYGEMPHTGLLPGVLNLLSHTAQAHLPRDGTYHSGLSPPMSIIKQEHTSQTFQRSKIMQNAEMISIEVSSSYITVTFIKLTQANKQTNK